MKKKEKKNNNELLKKILIVSLILIFVFLILLLIVNRYKDYSDVTLKQNKNSIFNVSDLQLDKLKFGSTEQEVIKELGKPKKTKKITKNIYKYKELSYKDLTLTLRENYNDYILVGIETSSSKYKVSREIKVGRSIKKVMKKYRIDNKRGSYLYGNYTLNALTQAEITENIYFGYRTKENVVYINRDTVEGNLTNTAELNIKYKKGKVKSIKWSYDFN